MKKDIYVVEVGYIEKDLPIKRAFVVTGKYPKFVLDKVAEVIKTEEFNVLSIEPMKDMEFIMVD